MWDTLFFMDNVLYVVIVLCDKWGSHYDIYKCKLSNNILGHIGLWNIYYEYEDVLTAKEYTNES